MATQTKLAPVQKPIWPLTVAAMFLLLAAGGLVVLAHYAHTPGEPAGAPAEWPRGVSIARDASMPTLIMFAHPHCPCTRASLGELERIVARAPGLVQPWIVFYKPSTADDQWEQTDLWRTAEAIPGSHVMTDVDGAMARQFRASTSGQTLVYGANGKLAFSGGITHSRGHAGESAGDAAIVEFLTTGKTGCAETSVFGCPILTSPSQPSSP